MGIQGRMLRFVRELISERWINIKEEGKIEQSFSYMSPNVATKVVRNINLDLL